MAKNIKKESNLDSKVKEVKESSAMSNKTPAAKGSGNSTPKPSATTTVVDSNLEKVVGLTLEKYNLVDGRLNSDASVTVINGLNHLNLPVPNVASNVQPQQDRDGALILRDFSTFSKTYKAKLANTVKGGHSGIAETPQNCVAEAMDRATGANLKVDGGPYAQTYPDALNFQVCLNIAGHLPKPYLQIVREWEDDPVNGLEPVKFLTDNSLMAIKTNSLEELAYAADMDAAYDQAGLLINRNNRINRVQWDAVQYEVPLNVAELDTSYNEAFNMDIDTHNYLSDFSRVMKNLNEVTESKLDNIPYAVKTEAFVYSKIMADIEFATFLYILFDSWQSNFDHVNFLGEKFGLIDNTIRSIFVGSAQSRRLLSVKLNNLLTVFDNIPVNSRVIDEWNRIKNASTLGVEDKFAEGNTLVIPHFKMLFNNINNVDGPEYVNASASANTTSLRVPLNNLLFDAFEFINDRFHSAKVTHRNNDNFTGRGNAGYPYFNVSQKFNHLTISAVRMTAESVNLLKNIMYEDFWTNLPGYFIRNTRYYNMLNSSGAFDGTDFKFLKPRVPNFRSAAEPEFNNYLVHAPYLMTLNPHIAGQDLAPVLDSTTVDNDEAFIRSLRHTIVHDAYSDSAYIQKFIKAFVTERVTQENENGNNGTVDCDINANLVSINISSSIIIPFSGTIGHLFSMNTNPMSRCNTITFTAGINQVVYETPMLFEFFAWGSGRNMVNNYHLERPHVGGLNLAHNDYLVADNWAAFNCKMTAQGIHRSWDGMRIPYPKAQFYSHLVDQTVELAGPFGFSYPVVNSYVPYWTFRPFADYSASDPLAFGSKKLSMQDLLINESK